MDENNANLGSGTFAVSKPLDWSNVAGCYEFGRPFPEQLVQDLFSIDWSQAPLISSPRTIYEPGAGTGRILLPLAAMWAQCSLLGVDASHLMLKELCRKVESRQLKNIEVREGDIVSFVPDAKFDLVILSSVLHAIQDWKIALANACSSLSHNGILVLIGEESDLHNLVLNREPQILQKCACSQLLEDFWGEYHMLRAKAQCVDVESSQVGVRWEALNAQSFSLCNELGFEEILFRKLEWQLEWSVSDLLNIVIQRCYSSIFTLEESKYQFIKSGLMKKFAHMQEAIVTSHHIAIGRFLIEKS